MPNSPNGGSHPEIWSSGSTRAESCLFLHLLALRLSLTLEGRHAWGKFPAMNQTQPRLPKETSFEASGAPLARER